MVRLRSFFLDGGVGSYSGRGFPVRGLRAKELRILGGSGRDN